jgi:hypothetical protein
MNEEQIQAIAATFPYPPTPDIASGVRRRLAARQQPKTRLVSRRLAWALVVLLLLLAGSLAVPQVRAAVLRIFRAGAITIFVPEEPEETAVPTATPISRATPTTPAQATRAQDVLLAPAGEMTLTEVRTRTTKELYIPEGWGPPDRVYHQTHDWPGVVIFVWLEPGSEENVRLSLFQIFQSN